MEYIVSAPAKRYGLTDDVYVLSGFRKVLKVDDDVCNSGSDHKYLFFFLLLIYIHREFLTY